MTATAENVIDLDLDQVTKWRSTMDTSAAKHQTDHDRLMEKLMEWRTASLVLLFCIFAVLGAISYQLHGLDAPAPAPVPQGNAIPVAARRVQLQITGDPYAEVIGHIGYLDGSESEYAPGVYSVTALAGARIELTADSGFSTCRIIVDGDMVSEQTAVNQQTVTCHWEVE